jgi:RHS repeat-associated protein
VEQSAVWRGRWVDITGYYQIGLRPYDPVAGKWLTYDSVWNERDPNWYTFAGGEPIMRFDADGRCVETVCGPVEKGMGYGFMAADTLWNLGVATFLTPNPENETPQGQAALTQTALDTFGSPLEKMGVYDSTPDTVALTQQLPASLGDPMRNMFMAYVAQPGVSQVQMNVPEPTTVPLTPEEETPIVEQQQQQQMVGPTGGSSQTGRGTSGSFWIPVPTSGGMTLANNQAVMGIIQNGQILGMGDASMVEGGLSHLQMAQQLGIPTTGGALPAGTEGFLVQSWNGQLNVVGGGASNFQISASATAALKSFFTVNTK